jgi:nitroreductase
MEKLADTKTPIHDLLASRWSPRAFSDRPVERDKLLSVLEAARWTPSSRNEQPWAYFAAIKEDPENFDALLGVLVESNRLWAQRAPVLILTVAHTRWEKEGTPNRVAIYDLGQAVANLVVQATSLGLHTHQMGGFNVEAARERFHVPEGWEPVTVVALGYRAGPEALPEALRGRESEKRSRKSLEEFVFSGTWRNSSPLTKSNGNK